MLIKWTLEGSARILLDWNMESRARTAQWDPSLRLSSYLCQAGTVWMTESEIRRFFFRWLVFLHCSWNVEVRCLVPLLQAHRQFFICIGRNITMRTNTFPLMTSQSHNAIAIERYRATVCIYTGENKESYLTRENSKWMFTKLKRASTLL